MRFQRFFPLLVASSILAVDFKLSHLLHPALTRRHDPSVSASSASHLSLIDQAQADITNLTAITKRITAKIQNFTDINGALSIQESNNDLVAALNAGQKNILAYGENNLTSKDALILGGPTQFLSYAVNGSMAALISKKPLFEKLHLVPLVLNSLRQQASASSNFSSTLISKIPAHLQVVSQSQNSQVLSSLGMGFGCFEKNEDCNTAVADPNRTLKAAQDTGAIPTSSARRMSDATGLFSQCALVVLVVLSFA